MENKRLSVAAGNGNGAVFAQVELNGVLSDERLTPKMARRAMRIAGFGAPATVWDNATASGYRVYARSARKLYAG